MQRDRAGRVGLRMNLTLGLCLLMCNMALRGVLSTPLLTGGWLKPGVSPVLTGDPYCPSALTSVPSS